MSAEKEKVNPERKGPAPSRGSWTEPAAPSLPKKSVSSVGPVSPGFDVSDCSGNNLASPNSSESSHTDGESYQ